MKSHKALFLIGIALTGGTLLYEYHKKHSCGCKSGKPCGCGGSKTPTVAQAISGVPTVPAPGSVVIPSTGMTELDDMISPNSRWSSADGSDDDMFPVIDTVQHRTAPAAGVRDFNTSVPAILHEVPQKVYFNS